MCKKSKSVCLTCGKEFSFYRSTLRGKDAKYCSRDCIQFSPWNKGLIEYSNCAGCGEKIRAFKKYCTHDCYVNNNNLQERLNPMPGDKNPSWKGGKPKCEDCGKTLSSYRSKWCKDHWSDHCSGKNSHNWKGGVTKKSKIERSKFREKMQKTVFERDDYTCQICNERGCSLQVDHIKSWADHVDLRFDIDNCRTLCMECHYFITFNKDKPGDVVWGHNLKHIETRG